MAGSSQSRPLCPVCCTRPTRGPNSAMCDSCRSEVCKLRRLDAAALVRTTNRAITRLKRIIAARFGTAHDVVQSPHDLSVRERRP